MHSLFITRLGLPSVDNRDVMHVIVVPNLSAISVISAGQKNKLSLRGQQQVLREVLQPPRFFCPAEIAEMKEMAAPEQSSPCYMLH